MTTPEPNPSSPWQTVMKTVRVYWADFRERAWSTFWQAFLAVLVTTQPSTNWSGIKSVAISAIVAGGAALLSMAKSIVVRNRGVQNSASSSKTV